MQKLNARNRSLITKTAGIASLLAVVSLSGAASAQNALGGGDVLDANLSTTGVRNTPSRDETLAYRVRNLLVTGNVAGGRGFRGSVGYTAAEDFRGSLGSDDLYAFRADSAFSAPNYLMYRDQLTDLQIGQDLGTLEFRREFTSESISQIISRNQPIDPDMHNIQLRLDRLISNVSLAESIERSSESRPIGISMDKDGNPIVQTTTSVLGLDMMSLGEAQRTAGMTVFDHARLMEDIVKEVDLPENMQRSLRYTTSFSEMLSINNRIESEPAVNRVEPDTLSYDDILKTVAERYTDGIELDEQTVEELDSEYTSLRKYLHGFDEETGKEVPTDQEPSASDLDSALEVTLPELSQPGDDDQDSEATQLPTMSHTPDVLPTLESFGIALRHGTTVETYASGDDNRFNELVQSAEQSMATGQYFWSERRFTRALRFQPFHPLASAGKANAQLGAGLYIPAALSLQQVFKWYPELIDVRYDRDIMPTRVRLVQNVEAIRERIEQGNEPKLMGFLLAYIGHQLDDGDMIDEGLEAMKQANANDRLLPLLRTIWTHAPEATDEPQTP